MFRGLIVLCLVAEAAAASPKYDRAANHEPELVAAEKLWTAAASERDRVRALAAWEAAAAAFLAVADGKVAKAVQQDAAIASILAWKNAMTFDVGEPAATDVERPPPPQPFDARDRVHLRAIEVYLAFAPPPAEVAAIKFLRANLLRRRDHIDEAIAGYLDVVEHHRDHEVAEYAANLLLDSYNRLQRYDELIALAEKLRADQAFLAGRPELATTVRRVHLQSMRGAHHGSADRDFAWYQRCGEDYLAIAAEPALSGDEAEELLYNAGTCFDQGRAHGRAITAFRQLVTRLPHSKLAVRALARLGAAEAQLGDFRAAADALEQYVTQAPKAKDARNAAADAITYAMGVGDVARARRLVKVASARYGWRRPVASAVVAPADPLPERLPALAPFAPMVTVNTTFEVSKP